MLRATLGYDDTDTDTRDATRRIHHKTIAIDDERADTKAKGTERNGTERNGTEEYIVHERGS